MRGRADGLRAWVSGLSGAKEEDSDVTYLIGRSTILTRCAFSSVSVNGQDFILS